MYASRLKPLGGLIHLMSLKERVAEAMGKMSKAGFARALRVSNSSVTFWLDGTTKQVKAETAQQMERVTGYRAGWIIDGSLPKQASNIDPGPDIRGTVPLISWVKAGQWSGAIDNLAPGEAEDWLPCIRPHSKGTYALRVDGDSMTAPHGNMRSYPSGCIIFVDPEKRNPTNGDRVVARKNDTDKATFKIYKNEDGKQWLQPLNPQHESMREEFTILGTVIGKWEDE